jgi:cytochrome c553
LAVSADRCFAGEPAPQQARFFETTIRPLLAEHCVKCHGPDKQKAGLRLDSQAAILKGSSSGPVVVAGQPEKSLLIRAVRYETAPPKDSEEKIRGMPPDRKLTDREIADLTRWVKMGLPFPTGPGVAVKGHARDPWAYKSPIDPPVPSVKNTAWPRSPLDRFILAKLEEKNLKPAAPSDRRTLVRRVTFDLTGLPPTPAEVDDFINDRSTDAFAKVVDRLLASPHYGEHWGRHWLDVARYADSNGLDENVAYGNAWRYRDYVVAAFNQDKPYDRFVLEQLAGDLLKDEGKSSFRIATGFLSLGPKVLAEVDEKKMEMDIIDEQVDTVSRTLMGLTLGCARCHDHKFDPLTLNDYYGLAGIFKSTKTMENFKIIARWHENPLPGEPLDPQDKNVPTAMGVAEGKIVDVPIHKRGSHLKLGDIVPRQVPTILAGSHPPTFDAQHSGRLELAQWLVRPEHPLTARVMVNRIWRWHFGQGIVRTVDNFGLQGEPPVNQVLLDWLAHRFMENKWSIMSMHRLILLSSTYQMSSVGNKEALLTDPENRLCWRAPVRRLQAEELRDALLAVCGRLDRTMGGSLLHAKNREFLFDHTSKDRTKYDSRRRSLYLPVIRNNVYDVFQLFDFPDPAVPSGDRPTTTIAPQALFLMNSEWAMQLCEHLADDLLRDKGLDDAERVQRLYRTAYSRTASEKETERGLALVRNVDRALAMREDDDGRRRLLAWACLCQTVAAANEFVYLD